MAEDIAKAVAGFSQSLILVGLAGSALIQAGEACGLRVASEGFPDRTYNPDGTLMSRQRPGAVLESAEQVAANAVQLVQKGSAATRLIRCAYSAIIRTLPSLLKLCVKRCKPQRYDCSFMTVSFDLLILSLTTKLSTSPMWV